MSKILVLAKSGFGKSFSIGKCEDLNHIGLDPKSTYIISVTSKPLPFQNSSIDYKIATAAKPAEGNRIITNNPVEVADILCLLKESPYSTVVIDDFNYLMQDYYMDNALKGGWDCPKKIGYFMGKIFQALEDFTSSSKNVIVLAHGEDIIAPDGRIYTKMKTTGRMVDEYITPEGKFDITLVGTSSFDSSSKKVIKRFITNEDEFNSSPKSPYGMFKEKYIDNDLGQVIAKIQEFYK